MHRAAARRLVAGTIGIVALPVILSPPAGFDHAHAVPSPVVDDSVAAGSCEPFDARVGWAKAAEQKEEFKPYIAAMEQQAGAQFASAMRFCFATVPEPQSDSFTLVADIRPDGKLNAIDVRPATNIAACFAAGLTHISFPPPPAYPGHGGFPMTIEMRIR